MIRRIPTEKLLARLYVKFDGEAGVDEGGLSREFFNLLSKEIFKPESNLFKANLNGACYQPSEASAINPYHLELFNFAGKVIGIALGTNYQLDAYFTKPFYKHMLGLSLSYHDFEDIDEQHYKSLKWIMENDIKELDFLTFTYESIPPFSEKLTVKDLLPDGKNQKVNESNKKEYVKLFCYAKMAKNISQQVSAFLEGFYSVIPKRLISIFSPRELELLICGVPEVNSKQLLSYDHMTILCDNSCS